MGIKWDRKLLILHPKHPSKCKNWSPVLNMREVNDHAEKNKSET